MLALDVSARYAPLLQRVYPEARFICVYRHPMDVIARVRKRVGGA